MEAFLEFLKDQLKDVIVYHTDAGPVKFEVIDGGNFGFFGSLFLLTRWESTLPLVIFTVKRSLHFSHLKKLPQLSGTNVPSMHLLGEIYGYAAEWNTSYFTT